MPSIRPKATGGLPNVNRAVALAAPLIFGCLAWGVASVGLATDPMRTALVVNPKSVDSLTIANHYVQLRDIPDKSIIRLPDVPNESMIQIEPFRQRILGPLLAELDARKLAKQVDFVAYSAGFPSAIAFTDDIGKVKDWPKFCTPVGSLTGLTTLYHRVMAKDPAYALPRVNLYSRVDSNATLDNPFAGQDRKAWDAAKDNFNSGKVDEAIATAEELIKKHPQQWPLRFHRAAWLASAGKIDEAAAAVVEVCQLAPLDRKLFTDRSEFAKLADHPDYKSTLERLNPTNVDRFPATPFSARVTYGVNGLPVGSPLEGINLLLSTALAVTHEGRGTTLAESIEMLNRAAEADGTGGPSEFFFSVSDDVRSTTRKPLVPDAALVLRDLGHEVIVDREVLPKGRERLMGAMIGSPNYDWKSARNKVLPGGIVENLTSTSGVLYQADLQTPMTDLIRGGAIGTSGTVHEPFALQFKFPTPLLYAYYALGCTLGEAYYLSVESPYQLLIIGDPLCRPFGDQYNEAFSVEAKEESQENRTRFAIKYWRGAAALPRINALEIFLNGDLAQVLPNHIQEIVVSHGDLAAGYHEFRFSAVSSHPLRMKSIQKAGFWIGKPEDGPRAKAKLTTREELKQMRRLMAVAVHAPKATKVAVRHLGERVDERLGDGALFEFPVAQVGYGPVRVIPEALINDVWVAGEPVTLDIPPP